MIYDNTREYNTIYENTRKNTPFTIILEVIYSKMSRFTGPLERGKETGMVLKLNGMVN